MLSPEERGEVAGRVVDRARLEGNDTVLDVGADAGLLVLAALDRLGADGAVIALDSSVDRLEELREACEDARVAYLVGDAEVLPLPDESVDVVMALSTLIAARDRAEAARELQRVLRAGGRVSIFEPEDMTGWFEEAGFAEVDADATGLYLAARKS